MTVVTVILAVIPSNMIEVHNLDALKNLTGIMPPISMFPQISFYLAKQGKKPHTISPEKVLYLKLEKSFMPLESITVTI
jgi:hypothetical protein